MKKILKTLLFNCLLIVGCSSLAMAQSNATTTASANVLATLNVEGIQSLDFGAVLQGKDKFMGAGGGQLTVSYWDGIVGGATFGVVEIEYIENELLDIKIEWPTELSTPDNQTLNISFVPNTGVGPVGANAVLTASNFSTGASIGNNTGSPLTGGDTADWVKTNTAGTIEEYEVSDISVPTGGTLYLLIGGYIQTGTGTAIGEYTGDLTITASKPN